MGSLWLQILAVALSVSSSANLTSHKHELYNRAPINADQVVIGSLADISLRYENGKPLTVIHILEFSRDVFPNEPTLLKVRLCGDQSGTLGAAVHTNIKLVYDLASHSRLTGCLTLISSEPWRDSSRWQT